MQLGTKEHIEMMESFEKYARLCPISCRFEKEEKSYWPQGNIYQDGTTNNLFKLYSAGYANARCVYIQG